MWSEPEDEAIKPVIIIGRLCEELATPHAFDITNEDAEVILEALEKLKGGHNNENHPHHDNRHQ